MILIHGIPTGPALWRHVLPRLKMARRLAWEMVGHAGSIQAGRNRDIPVARQADYLMEWIDSLEVEDSWPIPIVKAMQATRGFTRHLPDVVLTVVMTSLFQGGHDSEAQARGAFEVHVPPCRANGGKAALARQVAALDSRDTEAVAPALSRLGVPARVCWGAADQSQKISYGETLARDLSAPLRRIEGGKHFTPEDHPDIIAAEINALVAAVAAGGAEPQG